MQDFFLKMLTGSVIENDSEIIFLVFIEYSEWCSVNYGCHLKRVYIPL